MDNGIVVAGSLILDRHYAVDTYPDEGRLVQIRGIHEDVGGSGNLILDLAKLDSGVPVKVSAILGNDSAGRGVLKKLADYSSIETNGIIRSGDTPVTMVMDAADTRQRTFFYFPGDSDIYSEQYIRWDVLQGDIFQLEYLLLLKTVDASDSEYGTHAARILAEAQRRGMKTSIDMVSEKSNRVKSVVCAALKFTDFCTINELEAQEVTGIRICDRGILIEQHIRPVLERLAEFGVSNWVIIHSSSCSFGLDCHTGICYRVPSLDLPDGFIKGKTGAGDAYCSGVLYSVYRQKSLVDAMKFGTACASCSLSEVNGTDGMRTCQEVMDLYDRYKGAVEYETF